MPNLRSATRIQRGALSFMRIVVLSLLVALVSAAPAQAATDGVITGRIVNETTGKPAAGAEVILGGADENGSRRIRRSVAADADGRYRFGDLPSGADWLYVIDAVFDGGRFPGSPFTFPRRDEPRLQTSLKVWNTSTDPQAILVTRDAMFVLPSENSVGVVESVTVLNHGRLAYVGRGGEDGSAETTFGFGLPAGAGQVAIQDASFDVPELVATDFGFGITVALPPGKSTFTYSYQVPADGATYVLSKTALYPTADLLVFAGDPLSLDSDRMRESGTEVVGGKVYRRWVAPGMVDAGDTVLIQAVAEAEMAWLPFAIGAGVLLALISAAYLFMRRRPRTAEVTPKESRDDLIAEIASLDLAYETGGVQKQEWESRRERLKSQLVDLEKT
ncbi:MAG: carboxypeptidase-like regulatory domain-containing protein [Actinobacteria bacterium]|nr:carboxypeptidase-like regulatory domain-containing protein [Actinomycetota bacterium]